MFRRISGVRIGLARGWEHVRRRGRDLRIAHGEWYSGFSTNAAPRRRRPTRPILLAWSSMFWHLVRRALFDDGIPKDADETAKSHS